MRYSSSSTLNILCVDNRRKLQEQRIENLKGHVNKLCVGRENDRRLVLDLEKKRDGGVCGFEILDFFFFFFFFFSDFFG